MIRSRRSAARTLMLLRLAQACARGSRLEMISVWLLFLRLLRATTGVKRPNGNEITEGRRDSLEQLKEQADLSEAISMETRELSEMAENVTDLGETQKEEYHHHSKDQEHINAYFSEGLDTKQENFQTETLHKNKDRTSEDRSEMKPERSQDTLIKDTKNEESGRECVPISEADTDQQGQHQLTVEEVNSLSSIDEKKTDCQSDYWVEKVVPNNVVLSDVETAHQGLLEVNEPHNSVSFDAEMTDSPEEDLKLEGKTNSELTIEDNQTDHQVQGQLVEKKTNSQFSSEAKETNHQVEDQPMEEGPNVLPSFRAMEEGYQVQDQRGAEETSSIHQDTNYQIKDQPAQEIPNNTSACDLKAPENLETHATLNTESESVLEQQIRELAISDISTESCQDNDRDDLSDCLHVEMAIVSSDSENEEQWKTMFSPVIDEDEFGAILESEVINQDLATEDEMTSLSEHRDEPTENKDPSLVTESCHIMEQHMDCPTEYDLEDISYDSIHYSSLSKIAEDEVTPMKHNLQRLSVSTSELDKKLPQDYCVIQDTRSENVSTEHVDFKMARQQWQKMEEQSRTKEQTQHPTAKQDSCQGIHGLMFMPIHSSKRLRKDSDNLGLSHSDSQFAQFSPCSDDSGLDDVSYRSHYDEPETPVEREIRETMEREEAFRRERAISRPLSCGEVLTNKPRPVTLLTGRSDPDEKRRMYNTREDRCRSQRPSSTKPSTLSFTASPTSKSSYHEMVANNVIILEPDSHPTSPRNRMNNLLCPVTNRFNEWSSDTSNVIILETSNLIIRSASEFCLSTACQDTQESVFHNNPFFKLRSHSTQSLVDQEIKEVRQRDEEFRRQRAQLYTREKYDTVLVSPSLMQSFTYDKPGSMPGKCKSSPSSPLRARKMDRSTLSCDQKFPEAPYPRVRRKSALVQRWEAAMLANQQQHV